MTWQDAAFQALRFYGLLAVIAMGVAALIHGCSLALRRLNKDRRP